MSFPDVFFDPPVSKNPPEKKKRSKHTLASFSQESFDSIHESQKNKILNKGNVAWRLSYQLLEAEELRGHPTHKKGKETGVNQKGSGFIQTRSDFRHANQAIEDQIFECCVFFGGVGGSKMFDNIED